MDENTKRHDPIYCPECTKVIMFIPRDAKNKYIGATIQCTECKKKWLINEGKYFVLKT